MWNFGSLNERDENAYISRMLERECRNADLDKIRGHDAFAPFCDHFARQIAASQKFLREFHGGEASVVSLRDIARCLSLWQWFLQHDCAPGRDRREVDMQLHRSATLSLAHCYYYRLPTPASRERLHRMIDGNWRTWQAWRFPTLMMVLDAEQEAYLQAMVLPKWIARNTALKENIFLMLTCILTKTPLVVIGKVRVAGVVLV